MGVFGLCEWMIEGAGEGREVIDCVIRNMNTFCLLLLEFGGGGLAAGGFGVWHSCRTDGLMGLQE